jgi:hypothetical protein
MTTSIVSWTSRVQLKRKKATSTVHTTQSPRKWAKEVPPPSKGRWPTTWQSYYYMRQTRCIFLMCPHFTLCVFTLLYGFPHTTIYGSSHYYIYVSSYYSVCVLILLYMHCHSSSSSSHLNPHPARNCVLRGLYVESATAPSVLHITLHLPQLFFLAPL